MIIEMSCYCMCGSIQNLNCFGHQKVFHMIIKIRGVMWAMHGAINFTGLICCINR